MKTTNRQTVWLVIGIATIGVWFGRDALAQDESGGETNATAVMTTESAPDDAMTNATASDADNSTPDRFQRKNEFKTTFHGRGGERRHDAIVVFGKDAELKSNETAEAVVVIGGSAKVSGKVRDAVVAIGGDVKLDGAEVGDAAVAVFGSVSVGQGSKVHGDVVSVGGSTDVAEDATVDGHIQPVDFGGFGLPKLDWLKEWLVQCVFKLRPLAIAPHLGWLWAVAGAFFLLYLLVAAALPKPVGACVAELTNRPATAFLMGLLTKLLIPLVFLILAATGVGVFVVPFLLAALTFGALIGKAAFLEYLGQSVGRTVGVGALTKPLLALLVGALILTVLYLVPVLGLITLAVTGLWGLGAVVLAMFNGARRERPERPATPAPPSMPVAMPQADAGFAAAAAASPSPEQAAMPSTLTPAAAPATAAVSEAVLLPRASFWERIGAAFLDVILVGILAAILGHIGPGRGGGPAMFFLVALAYFGGLWVWKGTTVGGIILKLKVVRLDGKPVTFVVALVRALAAAFSVVVLFLGFLWIAFDRDKQGWHDKIAGTVVVRQPGSTPLVCV